MPALAVVLREAHSRGRMTSLATMGASNEQIGLQSLMPSAYQ